MYEKSKVMFQCHIAGFSHYDGINVFEDLKVGTLLTLKAEPDNPYDPEAVAVFLGSVRLGYVPRALNQKISSLLYFGHVGAIEALISARCQEEHPEHQVRMMIRVTDKRLENVH